MSGQWPDEHRAEGTEETGPWSFEEDPEYEPGRYLGGEGYAGGEGYLGGEGYAGGEGYSGPDPSGYPTAYPGSTEIGELGRRPRKKQRTSTGNGPWPELSMFAAVAVIIAAVALAVSSAHPQSSASGPAATTAVSSAVGAPAGQSSASAPPSSTTAPARLGSTTLANRGTPKPEPKPKQAAKPGPQPASPSAENLVVSEQVRQALVSSWLAANPGGADLGPQDVAGLTKGALYYGYQPQPGVYWALAQFEPSARLRAEASTAAGQDALARFTGTTYVFSWKPGRANWTLIGQVPTGSCPGQVPRAVLAVWALCGLRPPSPSRAPHLHA
jgi:hypothetical protein